MPIRDAYALKVARDICDAVCPDASIETVLLIATKIQLEVRLDEARQQLKTPLRLVHPGHEEGR